METGLSIVQVVVVLAAMLGFAGCEGEESVRLSDEIRSVANIDKKVRDGKIATPAKSLPQAFNADGDIEVSI